MKVGKHNALYERAKVWGKAREGAGTEGERDNEMEGKRVREQGGWREGKKDLEYGSRKPGREHESELEKKRAGGRERLAMYSQ